MWVYTKRWQDIKDAPGRTDFVEHTMIGAGVEQIAASGVTELDGGEAAYAVEVKWMRDLSEEGAPVPSISGWMGDSWPTNRDIERGSLVGQIRW